MHEHAFWLHYGTRVFGGRATAWLPVDEPAKDYGALMWRCLDCGEQGYEVPA